MVKNQSGAQFTAPRKSVISLRGRSTEFSVIKTLEGSTSPFTVSVAYLKKQSSEVFHVSTKNKMAAIS